MEKIRVVCSTNVDIGRGHEWPEFLCCRPQIGDYIISNGSAELRVVKITHHTNFNHYPHTAHLAIELSK